MARTYQTPSHTRFWLLLAVTLSSLPQLQQGPLWQTGVLVFVLLLRILIDRQRLKMPHKILRGILLVGVVGLTFMSYGRLYGPDAGVALLVSLFALKYLEVVNQRDAYVVIVLGFFTCATALLFSQSPFMFLYVMLCMALLTVSLTGINHSDSRASRGQQLRRGFAMSLQAIPVALVLFVLVPRVAPLWNMQISTDKARTGMSDSLTPGQISELSESSELAFRVDFDGPMPPPSERYWRGLTLSYYDGTTWRQAVPKGASINDYLYRRGPKPAWVERLELGKNNGLSYQYQVIAEPTRRRWLYALAVPFVESGEVGLAKDLRLVADDEVTRPFAYRVTSVPGAKSLMTLSHEERAMMLALPDERGLRARGLAQRWKLESRSSQEIVNRALAYFRNEAFFYTLRPPRLTENAVDDFLFRSRKGFCEHFASSFTFLMRAAGVPARIVTGYQGGEPNTLGSHLLVRQYDAHAWSEVWFEDEGWVRVDPTAAVSPDRIEFGLRRALENSDEGQSTLSALGLSSFSHNGLVGKLAQWADYVEFRWRDWVLNYDSAAQTQFLSRLLGAVTPAKVGVVLIVSIGVILLIYGLFLTWRTKREPLTPVEKEFWHLYQRVARYDTQLHPGITASELASRITARWPNSEALAKEWSKNYQRLHYDPQITTARSDIRHLRRLRNRLYRVLSRRGQRQNLHQKTDN